MQKNLYLFTHYPKSSSVFSVLLAIVLAHLTPALLASIIEDWQRESLAIITKTLVGLTLIYFIIKLGWRTQARLNHRPSEWHKYWLLACLPISGVAVFNVFFVEWSLLVFKWHSWLFLLADSLSTGLFEELTLRGLAFVILLKHWQNHKHGIFRAAIGQALIFGLIHFINLLNGFTVDVIAQVLYATMLGISFAGLMLYTRSIWPGVLLHAGINIVGSLNRTFDPNYVAEAISTDTYILLISFIAIFVLLPGIWCIAQSAKINLNYVGADPIKEAEPSPHQLIKY